MVAGDPGLSDPAPLGPRGHAIEPVGLGEEQTLPLVEERARIEKRATETGRVRVRTLTELTEELLRESLRSDAVEVTRVPVGRTLDEGEAAPEVRTEDGVTIIPVLEEILVVEKRLVLVEEVHVRQTASSEEVEVPITLRRQRAAIEHVSPDGHVTEQPITEDESRP